MCAACPGALANAIVSDFQDVINQPITLREKLESIIYLYEDAPIVKKYNLTRDEFIYLHLSTEGYERHALMDYFDCQKDKLYRLRKNIIYKTKAKNFIHALALLQFPSPKWRSDLRKSFAG